MKEHHLAVAAGLVGADLVVPLVVAVTEEGAHLEDLAGGGEEDLGGLVACLEEVQEEYREDGREEVLAAVGGAERREEPG